MNFKEIATIGFGPAQIADSGSAIFRAKGI